MNKQTSIEWLVKELNQAIDYIPLSKWDAIADIIQQAKQMHKEEISESFEVGYENGACVYDGEFIYHGSNYYNKIYGGNND